MAGENIWGLVGWYILPTFVANLLQRFWYAARYSPQEISKRPAPGSPEYKRLHRLCLILVAIGYLCFNTMQVAKATTGDNFYTRLDLNFDRFTQKQLRTNFRKLSLKYHPDKVGEAGSELFVHVREAHDILVDPIKRQAYDRFGFVSVRDCKTCTTNKDYFQNGLIGSYHVYLGFLIGLTVMSVIGQGIAGRYWLFLLLALFFALELAMLERSTSIAGESMAEASDSLLGSVATLEWVLEAMTWLIPNRVTFERIQILRNMYLSIGVATYKMGHLIAPPSETPSRGPQAIKDMFRKLEEKTVSTAEAFNEDLYELFDIYRDHNDCMVQMRRRMAHMYEESKLHENPTFKGQRMAIQKRVLLNLKEEMDSKED
ncbi:hypothetical protein EMPS_05073 [Entomortierella parvispora]|uniref:J domain-containing protein n=1 Tax=Entomortierella parvispora TaxID=205924 RepID=A0A9P3LWD9_9FUNG|nr:hypothetical protein EMPS_05073 [Entomortierella parvispora]